ncbi:MULTISPECIES: ribbon-helix-helix domain-containing protein [unclassified Actinomyces]|uniref:ribbon-helix-helix domain-containing protein n=1 Tax=unclassified Actinomyces TaxID=2609248 RepID=UPI0020178F67|nr:MULTISPECIES: ribbon-helix-helix domain-containing protein [unclassified Actinomyces]MCL3778466.1 CopG family transcriptional regulator [Actinomyces sp. AC-20-1]MCL3789309.1 CopG family transcriptional regulator [Actinomyces sp. 187325]MCL3792067.1 CopG family transcriptional regulator [Actinomyces sp. 186855]MCL3793976.1 CopG family transcriptional regulator [Actinomyces sp. 217892]
METIDGVIVTDEMIQEWADEAERGYDIKVLRKRGRRPMGDTAARVVPVRMEDDLVAAVDQRAQQEGTSRSEVIRSAVRAFVA